MPKKTQIERLLMNKFGIRYKTARVIANAAKENLGLSKKDAVVTPELSTECFRLYLERYQQNDTVGLAESSIKEEAPISRELLSAEEGNNTDNSGTESLGELDWSSNRQRTTSNSSLDASISLFGTTGVRNPSISSFGEASLSLFAATNRTNSISSVNDGLDLSMPSLATIYPGASSSGRTPSMRSYASFRSSSISSVWSQSIGSTGSSGGSDGALSQTSNNTAPTNQQQATSIRNFLSALRIEQDARAKRQQQQQEKLQARGGFKLSVDNAAGARGPTISEDSMNLSCVSFGAAGALEAAFPPQSSSSSSSPVPAPPPSLHQSQCNFDFNLSDDDDDDASAASLDGGGGGGYGNGLSDYGDLSQFQNHGNFSFTFSEGEEEEQAFGDFKLNNALCELSVGGSSN